MNHTKLRNQRVASRSLHTQLTACVTTLHTLPMNQTRLQNQRVGYMRYARGCCLIDGLPFQFLTSLKLALSDDLRYRLKTSNLTKLKPKNNKPFLLQHPNHKQKSYVALSQKLHCRRHILFHRQTRRSKIAPACRTYRLRVRLIWMCKNNIPLKPSPYACCRTTFTPFGRCHPTMRIIPYSGG